MLQADRKNGNKLSITSIIVIENMEIFRYCAYFRPESLLC